jgi:hypothetical protein
LQLTWVEQRDLLFFDTAGFYISRPFGQARVHLTFLRRGQFFDRYTIDYLRRFENDLAVGAGDSDVIASVKPIC